MGTLASACVANVRSSNGHFSFFRTTVGYSKNITDPVRSISGLTGSATVSFPSPCIPSCRSRRRSHDRTGLRAVSLSDLLTLVVMYVKLVVDSGFFFHLLSSSCPRLAMSCPLTVERHRPSSCTHAATPWSSTFDHPSLLLRRPHRHTPSRSNARRTARFVRPCV